MVTLLDIFCFKSVSHSNIFPFQLSSHAAVKSKNVYLHLADQHTNVTNHGVVQLFEQPHPYRVPSPSHNAASAPKVSPKVQSRRKVRDRFVSL